MQSDQFNGHHIHLWLILTKYWWLYLDLKGITVILWLFRNSVFHFNKIASIPRVEKSAEAFWEQHLVISPFLSFFIQTVEYSTNFIVIRNQCFWTMGHQNTMLKALEGNIDKSNYFHRTYGFKRFPNIFRIVFCLVCSWRKPWVFRERAPHAPHFFQVCILGP